MKYWVRYISLWIALSGCELFAAADPAALARMGDSLLARNEWYAASIIFQKAAWLSGSGETACGYTMRAAEALASGSDFSGAVTLLSESPLDALADSTVFRLKYYSALYAFRNYDFAFADNALMQADYLIEDTVITSQGWLLHALVLNEQNRWNEARTYLVRLNNLVNSSDALTRATVSDTVERCYDVKRLPAMKSREKARRMSTFVPGLGQVYAGFPGEGAAVFVTVLGISGVALVGILNQYYFTSIVLGNYLFGKFYMGGLTRTEFLVDKRNYLRAYPFNKRLRASILSVFPMQ